MRFYTSQQYSFHTMALLSTELYYAHSAGASVEALAAKLRMTPELVAERIEAARRRFEGQVKSAEMTPGIVPKRLVERSAANIAAKYIACGGDPTIAASLKTRVTDMRRMGAPWRRIWAQCRISSSAQQYIIRDAVKPQ
jgi:hypothetical protein